MSTFAVAIAIQRRTASFSVKRSLWSLACKKGNNNRFICVNNAAASTAVTATNKVQSSFAYRVPEGTLQLQNVSRNWFSTLASTAEAEAETEELEDEIVVDEEEILLDEEEYSDDGDSNDVIDEANEAARSFSSLDLHPRTLELLQSQSMNHMTEIQSKTWDAVYQGQDVVGRSRTGSGKTLAFLLPPLEKIIRDIEKKNEEGSHKKDQRIRMLIISPTRELASQIDSTASMLTKAHRQIVSNQVLYGGVPKGKDLQQFDRRMPTILTTTPGRLLDHLQSSVLRDRAIKFSETLKNIDVLVLDEMDRLLDLGFSRDIQQILKYLPPKNERQTLLFSATVPPSVKKEIRNATQSNAVTVDCIQDEDPASHTVNTVQQSHVVLPNAKQISGVVETIQYLMNAEYNVEGEVDDKNNKAPKIVVFFNTTAQVTFYAALLKALGMPRVLELHSKINQDQRSKRSDKFRKAPKDKPSILLTSDVSARGVDYPDVTCVLQVGSASDRETYIHRLGRTGRAGKSGKGILLLTHPAESVVLKSDLKGMKIPIHQELHDILYDNDSVYNGNSPESDALKQALQSMQEKSEDCFLSLLGFYFQRFKALQLRRPADTVVTMINEFSEQAMLKEPPAISSKVVQQFGLSRHPGITVRQSQNSSQGNRGDGYQVTRNDRGGSRDGNKFDRRGGGGKRGRSFDRHDVDHVGRSGRGKDRAGGMRRGQSNERRR